MTSTTWPIAVNSRTTVARVRTTPLTCGFQASVTMRMRWEGAGGSMSVTPARSVVRESVSGSCGNSAHARLEEREPVERYPVDQLESPIVMFDQRGAAFHPVAAVQI